MEFDAVLIPPRRAASIAQGLWHDRTINDHLDAVRSHHLDKFRKRMRGMADREYRVPAHRILELRRAL